MTATASRTTKPKATTTAKVAAKKVTNKTEIKETKPTIKKTTTALKAEAAPKVAGKTASKKQTVSPEVRHQMICERAYYIAQAHGFDPNRQMQNWLEAEAQINEELK